jgi:16S rRNA (cytosine967-C5)-methyltransferase
MSSSLYEAAGADFSSVPKGQIMQPGARLQAAIEVLDEILHRHSPASRALSDWGRMHRFAGSRDRAVIGNIVFDALRRRNSLAVLMGADSPRALGIGVMAHQWGATPEAVGAMCGGGRTPEPLSADERAGLTSSLPADAPDWVRGDYPKWLDEEFRAAFGADAAAQGKALAERAPVDLRVNTLKADRAKVLKALRAHDVEETPLSPLGVRVPARGSDAKSPNLEAEAAHGKGWFEVQDEGSQLAALLSGARAGQQVADVCAGAGGKTLSLAAQMENTGQLYAYDADKLRLRPVFERLKRAGARNVQVLPGSDDAALDALRGRMDVALVDAPCSGSGAWRRHPDAKWRLSPEALARRQAEQRAVLLQAAPLVRRGGRLVYVTCSVLPSENDAQATWFLREHAGFAPVAAAQAWAESVPAAFPGSAARSAEASALLLSPATHGTDGFFVAIFERIV